MLYDNKLWTPCDFLTNLPPTLPTLSKNEFIKVKFANSKIENCIIKNINDEIISNNNKKFIRILIDILKTMDIEQISQKTSFCIKLYKYTLEGYVWYPDLNLSIQYKDACSTLKEIIKLVDINNFLIYIKIKLDTGDVIQYGKKI
jgi:hypothetical protein